LAALSIMILMLSSGFLLFENSWAFVLPLIYILMQKHKKV
jgi:hypothetical protein